MCIRDRGDVAQPGIIGEQVNRVGHRLVDVHQRLARVGVAAVSYTHLRAHETVLDLVCRLLLEKKKDR